VSTIGKFPDSFSGSILNWWYCFNFHSYGRKRVTMCLFSSRTERFELHTKFNLLMDL